MMIGNLLTSPLQGEYAPLYNTRSLNVAEALSRAYARGYEPWS